MYYSFFQNNVAQKDLSKNNLLLKIAEFMTLLGVDTAFMKQPPSHGLSNIKLPQNKVAVVVAKEQHLCFSLFLSTQAQAGNKSLLAEYA